MKKICPTCKDCFEALFLNKKYCSKPCYKLENTKKELSVLKEARKGLRHSLYGEKKKKEYRPVDYGGWLDYST